MLLQLDCGSVDPDCLKVSISAAAPVVLQDTGVNTGVGLSSIDSLFDIDV